jgi:hypothetical protein
MIVPNNQQIQCCLWDPKFKISQFHKFTISQVHNFTIFTGLSVLWVAYATHSTLKSGPTFPRKRQITVTVWQITDALNTVVCAPDDGWKNHPKHIEYFQDINKLCNVASCWRYIYIYIYIYIYMNTIRSSPYSPH